MTIDTCTAIALYPYIRGEGTTATIVDLWQREPEEVTLELPEQAIAALMFGFPDATCRERFLLQAEVNGIPVVSIRLVPSAVP